MESKSSYRPTGKRVWLGPTMTCIIRNIKEEDLLSSCKHSHWAEPEGGNGMCETLAECVFCIEQALS